MPKGRGMTTREAVAFVGDVVASFIIDGGDPRALAGHDRLEVLKLADALLKLGYNRAPDIVREVASGMSYPPPEQTEGTMNREQQESVAQEFSVNIWTRIGPGNRRCVFERCIGKSKNIKTMADAATRAVAKAKVEGFVKPGDDIEADVSADASFDWFTMLKATV